MTMSISRHKAAVLDYHQADFDDKDDPSVLTIQRTSLGYDGMTRMEEFNLIIDERNNKHDSIFMPHGAKYPFEYKNYKDREDMQQFAEGPERLSQAALAYMEDELSSQSNPDMMHVMEKRARTIKAGKSHASTLAGPGNWFKKQDLAIVIATKDGLFGMDKSGAVGELNRQTETKEVDAKGERIKVDTIQHIRSTQPSADYTFVDGDKAHTAVVKSTQLETVEQNRATAMKGEFTDMSVTIDHTHGRGR